MAGERRFTRIPPESSGDRISMGMVLEVPYSGKTTSFSVGDIVSFVTSGITGTVTFVREDSPTTGIIVVDIDDNAKENNLYATVTENIQVDAVTFAQASGAGTEIYINKNQLVSGDNPSHAQKVDNEGSAYIRFTEGPAQLDAFGKLRVSQGSVIGDYRFTSGLGTDFTPTTAVSGTVTHDSTAGVALLSTTTTSGSTAEFRSNLWHQYFSGVSTNILMTCYHGDTGKTNNVREWGYFDDFNGLFFRLSGTTLSVVKRSNVGGSVAEQVIDQVDWSKDVLDGTGSSNNPSAINLDITKINLYWIDFEWLGGGKVRWGIYSDGQRITIHEENYGNVVAGPYMKYGNLPITVRNENTGTAGSSSEFRLVCASVHIEQLIAGELGTLAERINVSVGPRNVNSTADVYVHSLRTIANTHDTFMPTQIQVAAFDGANAAAVKLDFYADSTLGTPSFAQISNHNIENDSSATVSNVGTLPIHSLYAYGITELKISDTSLQHSAYKSLANGSPFTVTVVGTRIDGGTSNASVYLSYSIREFKTGY